MNLDDLTIDEVRAIQISDIRARLAARTPGSWIATLDNHGWCVSSVPDKGAPTQRMETLARLGSGSPASDTADACFIAAAPDDIAILLAEVDRLTAERDAIAKTAVQEWKDASGYNDLLAAYSSAGHERDLAQNRLEAWKSCLHCGNTRADGDFWEDHCPACKHEDRKVNDAFQRGVAAMREAAVQSFRPDPFDYIAPRIRALPDPEDKR